MCVSDAASAACLFLSFGTHIKFVCGFVQRNMSLLPLWAIDLDVDVDVDVDKDMHVEMEGAATTALNGNVRSSKHTLHTHTHTYTASWCTCVWARVDRTHYLPSVMTSPNSFDFIWARTHHLICLSIILFLGYNFPYEWIILERSAYFSFSYHY